MNCCETIQGYRADPFRKVQITVRELLELRAHVRECKPCQILVDETAAKAPPTFYQGTAN